MMIDHEYITGYIEEIEAATAATQRREPADKTRSAAPPCSASASNWRPCWSPISIRKKGIHPSPREIHARQEQERILGGMHEAYDEALTGELPARRTRDSSPRTPRTDLRYLRSLLGTGETFILVNDHDPKPLYYQFSAEHPGQFTWDYLEKGPEIWRVKIGRRETPHCEPGVCRTAANGIYALAPGHVSVIRT